MIERTAAALALFALLSCNTHAQTRAHKPAQPPAAAPSPHWDAEPEAFMGLRLGDSFDAQVKRCPSDMWNYKGPICTPGGRSGFHSLEGYPQLGIVMRVMAESAGNVLESVTVAVTHRDLDEFKAILFKRYGPPTSRYTVPGTTVGGAQIAGSRWQWSGERLTMVLNEYAGNLNDSAMTISMNSSSSARQAELERNAERQSGKL